MRHSEKGEAQPGSRTVTSSLWTEMTNDEKNNASINRSLIVFLSIQSKRGDTSSLVTVSLLTLCYNYT